ncbi:MAG TPA: lytic transglycosylase domain-containing protein [Kiritimatiellia bacterium]|nr:lytic transglycosylase domain-containing protein [Kiritimatiellia bacterium]HMO98965.1 lytic transglycosylase domain-containing protein [Kiritimatiellia bacterium]HMP96411.1 lytic transglycosylase domain-containing protein [Kiritimatiellia bacterium]
MQLSSLSRRAPLRIVVVIALGFSALTARPVRAQWDFGGIVQAVSELVSEYEFDPSLIRAPTPEEWNAFWRLLNNLLQAESLEDLAWLRPYGEMALIYLDGIEAARPYADWLRQRMDYLWMAEEIVREERGAPPPPRPAPPSDRPAPPPSIAPPRPVPSPPSTKSASRKSMDIDRWVKRLENRPPPRDAARFVPVLKPIFKEHGVPAELVWLAEVESSFDPVARSPVGALGLYQFMPATAERFGLRLRPQDERVIPERSADAAAQYLKFLHRRFGSWPLALAAYNAGEGRVGRLLQTHNASTFEGIADYLPAETRMYVPKVSAVIKLREGVDLARL